MHPAEKRLQKLIALKEEEKSSPNCSQTYIDDLNILIQSCKDALKYINEDGYRMVE
jgi:spore coat protein CotF